MYPLLRPRCHQLTLAIAARVGAVVRAVDSTIRILITAREASDRTGPIGLYAEHVLAVPLRRDQVNLTSS